MLTFLKSLFRKKQAAPAAAIVTVEASPARAVSPARTAADQTMAVPQVAVARLSLLAILQKLPDDLRANIGQYPDASVTIALPVATIQKQLAAGSVKMSLASLYRQAPVGTFNASRVEEKRMIEVPLAEVMRHVEPQVFRRRADQRRLDLPTSAPQLFGDRANRFAIAPSEGEAEAAASETNGSNGHTSPDPLPFEETPAGAEMTAPTYTLPLRMTPEELAPEAAPAPKLVPAAVAPEFTGEVRLPLAQLLGSWPEPARSEAAALADAALVIPAALLGSALTKGRTSFPWSTVRGWIVPPPAGPSDADGAQKIVLPLKVVAPAFLAHSRPPAAARQEIDLDDSIPALFDGGEAARPVTPQPQPAVEVAPVPTPALAAESSEEVPVFRLAFGAPAQPAAPAATPEYAPVVAAPAIPVDQKGRSPQQMIESIEALPGVAGAIVALREGLVVAAKLPSHMKGDTVAAFLPQIFARLNNYTQEMQLGAVEDLLLTVNGAHFQGYHLGEVYFAVLGKAGEALPWSELQSVVRELQAQAAI